MAEPWTRMSSPDGLPVTLSPRARQDFIDILQYTGETWGEVQLLIYRDKIDEALLAIASNPLIGHRRNDLPATHRAYPVGAHLIVYRKRASDIGVVRILHQRMCLGSHV